MVGGAEPEPVRQLVDGALEPGVLEGDELATLIADEVMVVVPSVRVGWLVSGDPVAEVESVDEVVGVQELQDSVDAGSSDGPFSAAAAAQGVFDLDCAECAVLSGEQVDDPVAGRAAVMTGAPENGAGVLAPAGG